MCVCVCECVHPNNASTHMQTSVYSISVFHALPLMHSILMLGACNMHVTCVPFCIGILLPIRVSHTRSNTRTHLSIYSTHFPNSERSGRFVRHSREHGQGHPLVQHPAWHLWCGRIGSDRPREQEEAVRRRHGHLHQVHRTGRSGCSGQLGGGARGRGMVCLITVVMADAVYFRGTIF